ncbi:YihY/virulence factor BrkB family protein [Motiliproteus sp. SC1-56]|uniref:YihY/virulence factor BrkB family protein n=1 Tax=Motiliproteus sp. SC1-56 TaxID=2799565 RepID=UPI001A8F31D3|nr:YihY/virulence factor BrkB family protein [Motiliproteus sp. SC1-56]
MDLGFALRVLKQALKSFFKDNVLSLSAALSFYTLLSFAPLLVLALWMTSSIGYDSQEVLLEQLDSLAGSGARDTAEVVIQSASEEPYIGSMAGIAGLGISLIGATTAFAQLQASLNQIWGIKVPPGRAIWVWLRRRLLSLALIGLLVCILILSLSVSSALGIFLAKAGQSWDMLNQLVSTLVIIGLFTVLFRYLADANLDWRKAVLGGVVTGVLFSLGKWGIGNYLARGDVGGAYGAAGSVVVLMVWVYYSSAIFFFGAEILQAWYRLRGRTIPAAEHAVKVRD